MAELEKNQSTANECPLIKNLHTIVWGVFFIWIGIAFLAHVGWGIGLLGVGAIALGAQVTRKFFGLRADPFGLAVGIVSALWGACVLLKIRLDETPIHDNLIPIVFIVMGVALFICALQRKRPQ